MSSFLDIAIAIPLVEYYAFLGGIAISFTLLIFGWWQNKRWCPERKIFIAARKSGSPIICLTDLGSHNSVMELGTKKNANSIKFDTQFAGARIDPVYTATGCEPLRFQGGLDMYLYAFESYLPQTVTNHLAYKAIVEYFRKNCVDLQFLTDMEFIALVSTPEMYLAHDVDVYIGKYFKNRIEHQADGSEIVKKYRQFQKIDDRETIDQVDSRKDIEVIDDRETIQIEDAQSETGYSEIPNPEFGKKVMVPNNNFGAKTSMPNPMVGKLAWFEQEIDVPEMVNRIEECKKDISMLPIAHGYYSGTEAFQHNAYAYSAQDLDQLLIIQEKEFVADMLKKINIMIYAVAALIVCVGGGILFYILGMVFQMKK